MFALTVLAVGLSLRFAAKSLIPAPVPALMPTVNLLTVSEAKEIAPLYRSTSLVFIKSLNVSLLSEAALRVKALGENSIYLNYVEESPTNDFPDEVEPSIGSVELLAQAQKIMEDRGITALPIWQIGDNPGRLIAKAAAELGVAAVIIGATKRSALINLLRGDVLRTLTRHLPRECRLIING